MVSQNSKIIKLIFSHQPEIAVDTLIQEYDDPYDEDAPKIYNRWKKIRQEILAQDEFRDPNYLSKLQALLIACISNDNSLAYGFLQSVLHASLSTQHKCSIYSNPDMVGSSAIWNEFTRIYPVKEDFYKFVLPDDILDAKDFYEESRREAKQLHVSSRSNIFNISKDELGIIHNECVAIVKNIHEISKQSVCDYILALQILSGRRSHELLISMSLHGAGNSKYSALVSGLAKSHSKEQKVLEIPLLCEYDDFARCFNSIRLLEGQKSGAVRTYITTKVGQASERLFGKRFDHTV